MKNTQNLYVRIDPELHIKLKVLSAQKCMSISKFVEKAIEEKINKEG